MPNRDRNVAISTPTALPPTSSARRGISVRVVTSRLVQTGTSARPSIGGISGVLPVAMMMCSACSVRPPASTVPGPDSRALALMTVTPWSV